MSAPEASVQPTRLTSLADRIKQVSTKPATISVPLASIDRNPDQPRKQFDEASLGELADSIRTHGVVQHLVVRPTSPGRYQLVAGERRWRAAKLAGLEHVPVVVRELSDTAALAIALVENLDREDMVPCDEVSAVAKLAASTSVQGAASALGKAASWVSKRKRIADAPELVVAFVRSGRTADIEALYELAKLAEEDEAAAEQIISTYIPGTHLRERIKAAARRPERPATPGSNDRGDAAVSHAKHGNDSHPNATSGRSAPASAPRLATALVAETTTLPASEGHAGDADAVVSHAKTASGDRAGGRRAGDGRAGVPASTRSSGTPAGRTLVVSKAVRRDGLILLVSNSGEEVRCSFEDAARDQLINLLENG